MNLLADIYENVLDFGREAEHVTTCESPSIVFLKRDPTTRGLVDYQEPLTCGWRFAPAPGRLVFQGILYELLVAEALVTEDDLKQIVAVKHGDVIYEFHRPSPFRPSAAEREWKFWLGAAEINQ